MEEEEEQEEGGGGTVVGRHLSKRARKNKGLVIVFDENARKEYVTGFHKRKKKRRKVAEQQKQVKERQKRLQARRERRLAMAEAAGQSESEDASKEEHEGPSPDSNDAVQVCARNGTVMYEDEERTTVVNTYSIDLNADVGVYDKPKPFKAGNVLAVRESSQTKRKPKPLQTKRKLLRHKGKKRGKQKRL